MNKFIFTLLGFVCLFSACKNTEKPSKPIICVSIEPLRYFTEQIAGNRFKVVTLVPNNANAETYEPTAKQMIDLSHSVFFVKVGKIGFERTWMERLQESSPRLKVVDTSVGIKPIEYSKSIEDPHTWMSAVNATIISQNIYKAIVKEKPQDSVYFKKNLNALLQDIANTHRTIQQVLAKNKTKTFLIFHPTLTYFAHDYGLHQLSVEEEEREPSAAQLKEVIVKATQQKAQIMFIQKEYISRNTEIVTKACKVKQVSINPQSYQWSKELLQIANSLK